MIPGLARKPPQLSKILQTALYSPRMKMRPAVSVSYSLAIFCPKLFVAQCLVKDNICLHCLDVVLDCFDFSYIVFLCPRNLIWISFSGIVLRDQQPENANDLLLLHNNECSSLEYSGTNYKSPQMKNQY